MSSQYLPAFQELLKLRYGLFREIGTLRSRRDVMRMGRDLFLFTSGRLRGNRAP